MVKDGLTPEERLLKLIEHPEPGPIIQPGRGKKFDFKGFVESLLKFKKIDKETLKSINLRTVNKVVISLCAALTIFCIFDFMRVSANLRRRLEQINASVQVTDQERNKVTLPKVDLREVVAQLKKRNIFTFLPPDVAEAQAPVDDVQTIATLKLVGVIWSGATPQAMVEYSKEQKTYLVAAGDQIAQFTVRRILRDRVIVAKGDQEWELK
jgi:type II secretory pathway component PulC